MVICCAVGNKKWKIIEGFLFIYFIYLWRSNELFSVLLFLHALFMFDFFISEVGALVKMNLDIKHKK